MIDYAYILSRGLPEKKIKYKEYAASHLVNYQKKKLYEYYECDNCKCEIKIAKKWELSTGGVVTLPISLTKKKPITVALCNKCFNSVLKKFEEGN